jgi:hypothetical protein
MNFAGLLLPIHSAKAFAGSFANAFLLILSVNVFAGPVCLFPIQSAKAFAGHLPNTFC